MIECRFQDGPAVAIFLLSEGCLCHPEDKEQSLCAHHAFKATPLGEMVLKEDLTVNQEFTKLWTGQ